MHWQRSLAKWGTRHCASRLRIALDRGARACEVAIPKDVINTATSGPVLVIPEPGSGEDGLLTGVGVIPLAHQQLRGVGGVVQDVVGAVGLALLDLADLLADEQHGLGEPVQLEQRLGLRGLDHQGAGDGEGHGGGVEPVVHEPLGDVLRLDAGLGLQGAQVQDELVGAETVLGGVQHGVGVLELHAQVVGGQDRHLGGLPDPLGPQHLDVRVGDGQDGRGSPGAGGHSPEGGLPAGLDGRVPRQEGGQLGLHPNGAHARTPSAVRDGEGLVQVEVAHVRAHVPGAAQTDLRVHVGPIQVHLPPVVVDKLGDLLDGRLEHPMGGGVGDHDGGQVVGVLLRLRLQVDHVDVPLGVTLDDDDLHLGHGGRGGVGAMGGDGDQAHVALGLATGFVVLHDAAQAGVFALGPGIGLQADGVKPGDDLQLLLQAGKHLLVARRLLDGDEGVQVAELGPGDGEHLAGGVQLHGARAQRDHGGVESQILALQAVDVPLHFHLAVVGVEDGVRQVRAGTAQSCCSIHGLSLGTQFRESHGTTCTLQQCLHVHILGSLI
mmetsp:Transcript_126480/g.219147  ORF Transcript_126480/g.219147 Transcript_126480/m.219147 type:complete len:549 (+) Transcript_126480:1398-3044(+)